MTLCLNQNSLGPAAFVLWEKSNAACTEIVILLSKLSSLTCLSVALRREESLWPADLEGIIIGNDGDNINHDGQDFPSFAE